MSFAIVISGTNIPTKKAKQSIEFLRHMAHLECYEIREEKSHGVIRYTSKPYQYFMERDVKNTYISDEIKIRPSDFYRTNAFGIKINLSNDRPFVLTFVKDKKGCLAFGNANLNIRWDNDRKRMKQTLNDHLWLIHTLSSIKRNFIPNVKIMDRTNYYLETLDRNEERKIREEDRTYGTTNLKDRRNMKNMDINNILKSMKWTPEILEDESMQSSGRVRVLRERMRNISPEYEYLPYIRQCIEMSLDFFGIANEG